MDPRLGIWGSKMGPMFRDFFVKNRSIWAARPRIAFLWKYPPGFALAHSGRPWIRLCMKMVVFYMKIYVQRLRSPISEVFSYGIRHISLWFNTVCLISSYTSLNHNGICCILYENASHTRLRNLCNRCDTHFKPTQWVLGRQKIFSLVQATKFDWYSNLK